MKEILTAQLKTFTTAWELKANNQFGLINSRLAELNKKMDETQKQLATLSAATSHSLRLPEVDEAKKGEKIKEPITEESPDDAEKTIKRPRKEILQKFSSSKAAE